jgi:hypothetical protein
MQAIFLTDLKREEVAHDFSFLTWFSGSCSRWRKAKGRENMRSKWMLIEV